MKHKNGEERGKAGIIESLKKVAGRGMKKNYVGCVK